MANTSQGAIFGILDRIYTTILNIDDKNPTPNTGIFVSMMNQGRPVNPEAFAGAWTPFLQTGEPTGKTGTTSAIEAAHNTHELVDFALAMDDNYRQMSGTKRISKTWAAIITGATLDPASITPMSAEEKTMYDAAYDDLYEIQQIEGDERDPVTKKYKMVDTPVRTKLYQKYLDCQKEYLKTQDAYTDAYSETLYDDNAARMWPVKGKRYITAIDNAMDDWTSVGKKVRVEDALATLAAQGRNPTAQMIADAKARYSAYQVALAGAIGDKEPYSYITPSNWCDEDADIWTKYTGTFKSSDTHNYTRSQKWSANLKVNFMLWKSDVNHKGSIDTVNKQAEQEDTTLSLEWAVLDIHRPWLDSGLLDWAGWKLSGGSKKGSISDGTRAMVGSPSSFYLPSIPTQLVVVRNVKVKNKAITDYFSSLATSHSTDVDLSYGPFVSADGHYSDDQAKQDAIKRMAREGLTIPGIQVIAWVSQVLPLSPKLDS